MAYLLSEMQAFMIAQGMGRKPSVAGALHPIWIEPRDGLNAPGEGQAVEQDAVAVIGLFGSGGIPAKPYESFLRADTVDVWYRVAQATVAYDLEALMRTAFVDKRLWAMGALTILESTEWRSMQRLSSDPQGFIYVQSFLFWRRAV